MPSFQTPQPISVTVEMPVIGNVRVTASDRLDTVVEVRPRDESKHADVLGAQQTTVEYSGGVLLVKAPRRRRYAPFSSGGSIEVTIEVPTGSRLDGDLALGTFDCVGRFGECHLKTAMGNIRLDEASEVHIKTSCGNVNVGHADGDLDVSSSSGEVRIGEVDGAAVIKNSNGATIVGEVTGDVRVKAANGDITIDRAHGSVTAKSANGNVRVGEVSRGSVLVETAVGTLDIGIRAGTAAWLDVSSRFGEVRNELYDIDGPDQSDSTVEVRGSTNVGDIVIRRAAASPAATDMRK